MADENAAPTTADDHPLENNILRADLVVVNLIAIEGVAVQDTQQVISYTALSHTWDSEQPTDDLCCNGQIMPITQNLATALRALQTKSQALYLWADAVCINQADKHEQAEQVAHMLSIYQKAQRVVAWLGERDGDSPLAISCVRNNARVDQKLRHVINHRHQERCLAQLLCLTNAMVDFYSRPWLGRTWIRQEIYGARQLTVQCGADTIDWQDFLHGADLMMSMHRESEARKLGGRLLKPDFHMIYN